MLLLLFGYLAMYACVCLWISQCMCFCRCMCVCVYVYVHVHVYVHVYLHACVHVCTHLCICVSVCLPVDCELRVVEVASASIVIATRLYFVCGADARSSLGPPAPSV